MLLKNLLTVHHDMIFLGDFILHVDNCADYYSQKILSLIEACDMNQHVTDTTHVKGHILDLLIAYNSCNSIINSVSVIDPSLCDGEKNIGGDHSAVAFKFVFKNQLCYDMCPADVEKTIENILQCRKIQDLSENKILEVYNDTLRKRFRINFPLKDCLGQPRSIISWFTQDLPLPNVRRESKKAERLWRRT